MSIDEKRNANLNEIYSFYCKQTSVNGKHATFERLSQESTVMTMGKFMYFSRDFKLMEIEPEDNE